MTKEQDKIANSVLQNQEQHEKGREADVIKRLNGRAIKPLH